MIISGEMTVVQIETAHADLLAALKKRKAVKLDLSKVTDTDLTLVQLIESARAYAAQNGRQLSLSAPVAAPVRQVLERGGFLDDATSDRTKFWLQGAMSS